MIKSEHVRKDLEEIKGKGADVTNQDVAHAISLLIKVALDIRQNQVAIMKHKGIDLSTGRKDAPKKD